MFGGLFRKSGKLSKPTRSATESQLPWLERMPASVVFIDVETTGLGSSDRIITFAGIGLKTATLAKGNFEISYIYLIFDPLKKCHPKAVQVHGYADWMLQFQDQFSLYAQELSTFINSHQLIVAHNAAFDIGFVDREMMLAGSAPVSVPIYCTMEGFRMLGTGESASLDSVCRKINISRATRLHGALEDAWLAMRIYLWLHGCPVTADFPSEFPDKPTNFREPLLPPSAQMASVGRNKRKL